MTTSPYTEDPLEKRGTHINPASRPAGAPTTERTVAAAHRSIDAVGVRASRSEQTLRNAAATSVSRYTTTRDQLRSQINCSVESTRRYVREHPLVAAGAAFAAGAIVTRLFGKRR
jgi:ElaB/YqjD/DUF883 family membrane-anchored ribosome-binding protein